jgi:ATP-binding cassette subfamily B protein
MATYFKPYQKKLWQVVFLLLVIGIANSSIAIIVSKGIDILNSLTTSSLSLLIIPGAVLISGVLVWGANWVRRRLTVRIVGDTVLALRNDAFSSSVTHDLSFYDEYSSGRVVSRITSDTHDFGQVATLVTDLASQFIQALILAFILIYIDWRLSLVVFGFLPMLLLAALGFRRLARIVTRRGMQAMANVNATIKETVSGIVIAKNFRQELTIFREFDEANKKSYQVNVQRGFVLSLVFPTLNVLGGIGTAILVYVGALNVVQGAITAGAWFLFLQSLERFFFPVLNLSAFWAQIQTGLSAAERVFALIDAESQVKQRDNLIPERVKGEIVFDKVDFRYSENEPVLTKFSLHIEPGENIALVGHTGAGKSSIAKLIARFYEYQGGQIIIEGTDIRNFDLKAFRTQLGIVSQTPFLFSGTVYENISYGCRGDMKTSELLALANKIGDGEWLNTLPNGLTTEVGERGGRLSMGQRQLVALMRVLVQNPSIFILDEATASVDPFTEWQIQQALDLILSKSTSILIAHRLTTIKAADRIIVVDQGEIIEQGDHESLLSAQGHYAELYNTYFRHQSLSYVEQSKTFFLAD